MWKMHGPGFYRGLSHLLQLINNMENTIAHKDALNYILSGKATVGIHSGKTGNTYWYYVHKKGNYWKVWKNNSHQVIATIRKNASERYEVLGEGSVYPTQMQEVLCYVVYHLENNNLDSRVTILHSGRCGRCKRELTDPESLATGIGPECRKKLGLCKTNDF